MTPAADRGSTVPLSRFVRPSAARNYKPRLEVTELPERLQGELVRVVKDVWDEAMIEAVARLADETALVRAEREANHALRDEAWVEAENVALRARQAEMEAEIATMRTEVRRLNALEFWDRVMREIAAVLPRDAWVADRDVLRLLPPSLAQEAIRHGKPLTRGRLNGKMGVRVTHGKYFEVDEIEGGGKRYRRALG